VRRERGRRGGEGGSRFASCRHHELEGGDVLLIVLATLEVVVTVPCQAKRS